jgi:hypothetical protein
MGEGKDWMTPQTIASQVRRDIQLSHENKKEITGKDWLRVVTANDEITAKLNVWIRRQSPQFAGVDQLATWQVHGDRIHLTFPEGVDSTKAAALQKELQKILGKKCEMKLTDTILSEIGGKVRTFIIQVVPIKR